MKLWKKIKIYCHRQRNCKECACLDGATLDCPLEVEPYYNPGYWIKSRHPSKKTIKKAITPEVLSAIKKGCYSTQYKECIEKHMVDKEN
jgi:hypothetical protein